MYRHRSATKKYNASENMELLRAGQKSCPFCRLPKDQIVHDGKDFWLVKNKYPYHYWEFMPVVKHLMIIPKKHIEKLSELTKAEKAEYVDLLSKWETKGFNVYLREAGNTVKSVPHQHTHLIKTANKKAKFVLYIRKPYLLIRK